MLPESIQERVFAFVARECSEPKSKLSLNTTLLEGLGMDGDDAVEFFQKFEKEFSVDLKQLGANWNRYFGPEGMSLGATALIVAPGSIISILLIKLISPWASFVLGFGVWLTLLILWHHFFRLKRRPQITIQDLVDSATARIWTKMTPGKGTGVPQTEVGLRR